MNYPQSSDALRASFTVETALLMPLIFATVFSCVFLSFQYHNSAAMTANAAEAAITGAQQKIPSYVGAGSVSLKTNDKKFERTASVSGHTSSWLLPEGNMVCVQTYRKVNPTRMLRRIHAISVHQD